MYWFSSHLPQKRTGPVGGTPAGTPAVHESLQWVRWPKLTLLAGSKHSFKIYIHEVCIVIA